MSKITLVFLSLLVIFSLFITPMTAVSTTTVEGAVSGSVTYCQKVSMETSGTGLPRFGANQSIDYTYDGSQTSVLTNGRTYFTRKTTVDQTDSNYYAGTTGLSTDYMALAEDTAGMMNIQSNEPENMCDQNNFLNGYGTSGQYPVSESFEGKTGVVLHAGGAYESEVGLNNGDVHLSGAADITSKGYLYQDKIVTSMKGFDKNATALNLATSETMHTVIRTATTGGEEEVHKRITSEYTTITPAFDEVLKSVTENAPLTSISADRVDEANLTSTTPSNQSHRESKGLEEISGQSIVRN